jgi:hypothetical protein
MSDRDYDWLGSGAYFWEADQVRALEWAEWKVSQGQYHKASVLGAVIELRNCLDLSNREDIPLVRGAYNSFIESRAKLGQDIPANRSLKGDHNADRVLRFLDCAVINHLHNAIDADPDVPPFDTVRGMFTEGAEVYPGCGFKEKTHVQIAVRNKACIRGVFFPRP